MRVLFRMSCCCPIVSLLFSSSFALAHVIINCFVFIDYSCYVCFLVLYVLLFVLCSLCFCVVLCIVSPDV